MLEAVRRAIKRRFSISQSPLSPTTVGMDPTAGQGDPPAPIVNKSWVTSAKQNKVLKKYDLDISTS